MAAYRKPRGGDGDGPRAASRQPEGADQKVRKACGEYLLFGERTNETALTGSCSQLPAPENEMSYRRE
jgi:hypothetical protein